MLKKLAKYGNSSALVLDKAILELLGIEEGSVVRIKTDGVSIIITPHDKAAVEKISETYTAEQAQTEAMVKNFFKGFKKIESAQQAHLEKELIALFEKQKALSSKLFQRQDYMEELQKINTQKSGSDSRDAQALIQAINELKANYSPELVKVEQEIATFEVRNKLSPQKLSKGTIESKYHELSEDQKDQMLKDFAAVHEKYKDAYIAMSKLLDNPEYLHKAQLIAEKYKDNQDSDEYIQAIHALRRHFIPELKNNAEELAAVAKKYNHA